MLGSSYWALTYVAFVTAGLGDGEPRSGGVPSKDRHISALPSATYLEIVRNMRNDAAHDFRAITFDSASLCDRARSLVLGERLHVPSIVPFMDLEPGAQGFRQISTRSTTCRSSTSNFQTRPTRERGSPQRSSL